MSATDFIQLSDGLAIYKQRHSKNYYVYLRQKDENGEVFEFRKSTRTDDKQKATKFAFNYLFVFENNITEDTFQDKRKDRLEHLITELTKELRAKAELSIRRTPQEKVQASILNEMRPLVKGTKIRDLDTKLMKHILRELGTNITKLANTRKAIALLFEYAEENKLIRSYKIPEIPKITLSKDREQRIKFSEQDLSTFFNNIDKFVQQYPKRKLVTKNRIFFKYLTIVLNRTGIRPGTEAESITYNGISNEYGNGNHYVLSITQSKTVPRTIPIDDATYEAIKNCVLLGHNRNFGHLGKKRLIDDYYIFRRYDEDTIELIKWDDIFEQYMKFLGMKDKGYTLYSFRHTHITRKLLEGTDVYLLAKHCGTSVAMIEQYYSKIESIDRASELIEFGDKPKKKILYISKR